MTIEEAEDRIDTLEGRIDTLEGKVDDLTSCVEDLLMLIDSHFCNRHDMSREIAQIKRSLPDT